MKPPRSVQALRQNTASGISRSDSAQEILPNLGNEASPLSPSPSTEYGIGHKPQRFRTGNSPESWQRNETGFRLPIQASEKGTVSATQAAAGLAQEIRRSLAGPLRMKAGQSFRRNRKNSAGFLTKAGGITVTERYLSERASTCVSPRPARSPR